MKTETKPASKHRKTPAKTAREALRAAGRVRPLGKALRKKIIPAVTLEETRAILKRSGGTSLGEIIEDQRGAKA
jgi:hypothetical protein